MLTAGTLAGSGEINANGGMGNLIGGGGGGGALQSRMAAMTLAVWYRLMAGAAPPRAAPGRSTPRPIVSRSGQVVMDNGGQAGTNTTFGLASPGTVELTVKNGAVFSPPNTLAIGTLLVASNGWVSVANQEMMVTGDATVQAGGGIIADGTGSPAGKGAGAGRYEGGNDGLSAAAGVTVVMGRLVDGLHTHMVARHMVRRRSQLTWAAEGGARRSLFRWEALEAAPFA